MFHMTTTLQVPGLPRLRVFSEPASALTALAQAWTPGGAQQTCHAASDGLLAKAGLLGRGRPVL